ncbi:cardiolipin synthase [Pantoea sp. Aalb]|uniref:cardiolipin synthase n=1 Tax=Pantoea sp. Aalb TaxID=2576762 RepID=UPI00132B3628|nr:cardiolipin synthase [Pantoea sp. Aalb]MXP67386.1 cardiolipin synthase [Pantoea sp. Aalb]
MNILCTFISWIFILIYLLLIVFVTIRILMQHRTINSILAWLLVICISPIIGVIIYLTLGELNLGKKRSKCTRNTWISIIKWLNELKESRYIFTNKHSNISKALFNLCRKRQSIRGVIGNKVQLITNTSDVMNAIIHDINFARKNIEMAFYIWQSSGLTDKVAESLIAASRRGVKCRLMLDSVGSIAFFNDPLVNIMRNAGIDIVEALQVSLLCIFLRRMDLRQHRKVILIDNKIAYTGSMNMVDPHFFKKDSGVGPWIDLVVRMEGPVSTIIGMVYACDWEIETGKRILPSPPNKKMISLKKENNYTIQVIPSGPGFSEDIIHQVLLTAVYSAHTQLIMTTPYFIPSDELLHAICTAAYRGVEVKIILPRYNDSVLVGWASRAFFTELLKAGVKIYQFEKGLLHTKSILVDKQLCLVGTVNLDMRSFWLNFELTLAIDDARFGSDLARIQDDYIASSYLLDDAIWIKRAWWQRIIEKLFHFLNPLL